MKFVQIGNHIVNLDLVWHVETQARVYDGTNDKGRFVTVPGVKIWSVAPSYYEFMNGGAATQADCLELKGAEAEAFVRHLRNHHVTLILVGPSEELTQ